MFVNLTVFFLRDGHETEDMDHHDGVKDYKIINDGILYIVKEIDGIDIAVSYYAPGVWKRLVVHPDSLEK